MNKRGGESGGIGWVVYIIIAFFVLVGVMIFLYKMGIIQDAEDIINLFPGSDRGNESEEIPIVPGVVVEFDEPKEVVFYVFDRGDEGLFYNCNNVEGWKWYYENIKKWWKVSEHLSDYPILKEMSLKNKDFLISLYGQSCEDGLGVLVKRVEEAEEKRGWYQRKSYLRVWSGDEKDTYYPGSNEFKDVRILIKKINRMGK